MHEACVILRHPEVEQRHLIHWSIAQKQIARLDVAMNDTMRG